MERGHKIALDEFCFICAKFITRKKRIFSHCLKKLQWDYFKSNSSDCDKKSTAIKTIQTFVFPSNHQPFGPNISAIRLAIVIFAASRNRLTCNAKIAKFPPIMHRIQLKEDLEVLLLVMKQTTPQRNFQWSRSLHLMNSQQNSI